jgi:hypothetical protein
MVVGVSDYLSDSSLPATIPLISVGQLQLEEADWILRPEVNLQTTCEHGGSIASSSRSSLSSCSQMQHWGREHLFHVHRLSARLSEALSNGGWAGGGHTRMEPLGRLRNPEINLSVPGFGDMLLRKDGNRLASLHVLLALVLAS